MLAERGLAAALALGAMLAAAPVAAHPLGNFSINRYAAIRVEPEAVEIRYLVDMAEIPTFQEMQEWGMSAAADHPETAAYLVRQGDALGRGLRVDVDGRPLALRVQSRQVHFAPGAADLPTMKIALVYRAPIGRAASGRLSYRDENFADRLGWREVVARAAPGMMLAASSVPERDRSRELSDYPGDLLASPPQVATADVAFESAAIPALAGTESRGSAPAIAALPGGAPAIALPAGGLAPRAGATPAAAVGGARDRAGRPGLHAEGGEPREVGRRAAGTDPAPLVVALRADPVPALDQARAPSHDQPPAPDDQSPARDGQRPAPARGTGLAPEGARPVGSRSALTDLMTRRDMGPGLLLFTMATAVVLGALHALEPGHGKTVVAAYLVGSKGTAWHAVFLGLAVTVSHTAGVFLLGAVTLYASRYVMPDRLYPWLGALSGLAIAGVGLALLRQRWGGAPHGHGHDHGHAHPHHHHHDLPAAAPHHHHEAAHVHPHSHDEAPHAHPHSHDETPGGHPHPHSVAPHGHPHSHGEAAHGHPHHHHVPAGPASVRSLVALGLSGGIVPCPGALVVLLSALAWRRLGLGILLVVAFSVGLAAVLVAIGLFMVHARRLLSRVRDDGPLATRWLPLASSAVVTVLGVLIAVQALSSAGILGFRLGS